MGIRPYEGVTPAAPALCGKPAVDDKVAVFVARFLRVIIIGMREARRDDRDLHLVIDIAVDTGAENDIRRIVDDALYESRGRLHFVHGQVVAADDVEDDALCALDSRFEQRAVDGEANRFDDPVLALGDADAHVREALILEDGAHIREVEVDERGG